MSDMFHVDSTLWSKIVWEGDTRYRDMVTGELYYRETSRYVLIHKQDYDFLRKRVLYTPERL